MEKMKDLLQDESGQGITEYGAILAFVAILVALIFNLMYSDSHITILSAIYNAGLGLCAWLNYVAGQGS